MIFTSVGVVVALAALAWYVKRQVGVVLHVLERNAPAPSPEPSRFRSEDQMDVIRDLVIGLGALEGRVDTLTQAVAEGIDHVDRNEKRVRGIVQGATRRFEKAGLIDAGVQAEADTLPDQYEIGSGEEAVPPLHEDLGQQDQPDPWLLVPGIGR